MHHSSSSSSIILIGMPGSGKSTLGEKLARRLNKTFIDTDRLIQAQEGTTLQDYLNKNGFLALRQVEEQVIVEGEFYNAIVSTGGSVIYSAKALQALSHFGPLVWLDISYKTLMKRVTNQQSRGLACAPGTDLCTLYNERHPLYERYAEFRLDANDCEIDEACQGLLGLINPQ
ncbi:MAG: shikimate kinase [Lentisphaeria bacterium]|jgi:shikimate kinase